MTNAASADPNSIIMPLEMEGRLPTVRKITTSDLLDALRAGFDDFKAMPSHAFFTGLLYAIVGLLIARSAFGYDLVPMIYPMVTGFALVGPIAAIGLYELSRRREMGLDTSWQHLFDVRHSPSFVPILVLSGLLIVLFSIWIAVADGLYVSAFGHKHLTSLSGFLNDMLTTSEGLQLVVVGNLMGLMFAVAVLCLTVVSFPLLLDRHVGVGTALATSLLAVAKNPLTLGLWGLIVAVMLFAGSLPLFMGLAIVVPVLGHATWHLYRKVVEPGDGVRPDYQPPVKYKRYGAQFPASLFVASSRRDDDA